MKLRGLKRIEGVVSLGEEKQGERETGESPPTRMPTEARNTSIGRILMAMEVM